MYSNKKKEVKKFVVGGFLLPAIAQGALGLGQALFGGDQRRKAKDRIEELRKSAPQITIPTAIRKLADEPIAEEFMEAQELGGQRRTATAIDALGRGGSRSLALLPQVLENERIGEQQRAGQYEQARKGALSDLGAAQERVRDLKVGQYQNEMDAARQSLEAGQTNIFGGLGQIGRGVAYLDKDYISTLLGLSPNDEVMQKSGGNSSSGDAMRGVLEADQFQIDHITGLPRTFEKGGKLNDRQQYIEKARSMRSGARKNPDGTESTVKMAWTEADGKFIAYPTLFQKENGEWYELSDDENWEAFEEAKRRGETFVFNSKEEAEDFAGGSWKQQQPLPAKPRPFKDGGMMKPPMKTKGEFDHNTNKKALIDEETGEKEAELSGDEVVFNKDDHEQIEMLIKEGKADELLKFMKATFAKFDKDAEKELQD